jgi:uncharacterized membrane protein SpoIIM required for sporulation
MSPCNVLHLTEFMQYFTQLFVIVIGIWCIGGTFVWWLEGTLDTSAIEKLNEWNTTRPDFDTSKIISNNLLVITIALTGLFTGGITAILTLLVNGFVAFLFLKNLNIPDLSWGVKIRFSYVLFEIFALWLSSTIGLLGYSQVSKPFTTSRFYFLDKEIRFILTAYLLSIVLTIIAGLLEADVITMLTTQR